MPNYFITEFIHLYRRLVQKTIKISLDFQIFYFPSGCEFDPLTTPVLHQDFWPKSNDPLFLNEISSKSSVFYINL